MASESEPGTPWDINVVDLQRLGLSLQEARDGVAWYWLQAGDARALASFLLDGYVPGAALCKRLGWSLLTPKNARLPADLPDKIPYQLVAKRRSGKKGRSISPEAKTRDQLLALNMRNLIKVHGLTYEQATTRLIEAARETGGSIGEKTIQKAYDSRFPKKTRI